jgi:hypothetical protein
VGIHLWHKKGLTKSSVVSINMSGMARMADGIFHQCAGLADSGLLECGWRGMPCGGRCEPGGLFSEWSRKAACLECGIVVTVGAPTRTGVG